MKSRHIVFTIAIMFCGSLSWGWVCPSGQHWSQVANGTPSSTVVQGLSFVCVPDAPTDPTSTSANSTSTSTATGGNSNVRLSNTLSQSQKQGQSQSSSNTNNNQSQGGSVSDVGNSTTNIAAPKIPVASAYAPTTLPSAPCVKNGFGAGGQTMLVGGSFGQGGKIDEGCDAREDARAFFLAGSRLAGCKMLVSTKAAKKAQVTLEDCMASPEQKPEAALIVPDPPLATPTLLVDHPAPPPQIILIEQPVTVEPTPQELRDAGIDAGTAPVVKAKPASHKPAHHTGTPCVVPNSIREPMEK